MSDRTKDVVLVGAIITLLAIAIIIASKAVYG